MIAIITMLIDHTGAILISPQKYPDLYLLSRSIGRLAFPIFVFLIVEGFHHTRDVKKYLKRLGIFSLVSEIPFDLAFYNFHYHADIIADSKTVLSHLWDSDLMKVFAERLFAHQNVFFTLFLGLLLITIMNRVELKYQNDLTIGLLLNTVLTVGFCAAAIFLKTDYDAAGILLITAFYLFRGGKFRLTLALIIIMSTMCDYKYKYFLATGNLLSIVSIFAVFAMIPIAFYNGKKGKNVKYLFYIFYPAHLLILFMIKRFL
jgi:hypothetical protein